MGSNGRLLLPKEVAAILRLGESTVFRLAQKGILPAFTIPGTDVVRFSDETIHELIHQWASQGYAARRHKYPKTRAKRRPKDQPEAPAEDAP